MSDTPKLTPKQEAFCQAYIETGNASEAYRKTYNASGMKDATINREAKALTDNPKITARLSALQQRHSKRHEITVDSLVDELESARLKAMTNPRGISAAVSAIMGKAKLLGLIVEKAELSGKDGGPIEVEGEVIHKGMTPQQAAEVYARARGRK